MAHDVAVLPERPYHGVVGERFEVVLVEDFNLALLHVDSFHAHILVNFLHLEVLCLGREVGAHDTVHAEHAVVGLVVHAEVAAVAPIELAFVVDIVDSLVHPVPDGTAHEEVGALYGVPVVHQSAHGVTHGVGIFGDVERINHVVFSLHGFLYPGDGGVLVGAHVDDVVVALVLHGTGGVVSLDGFVSLHEVVAGTGLVAQTPNGHRGVVHRGVNHLHVAGDVGVLELGHVGKAGFTIIVLMAFDIGLILEIDAVLVAEVVPVGRIGIVAVAHVVDVALLHEEHFVLHLLAGHVVSCGGIVFVAVHALHLDGLAVEVVIAACESELVLVGGRFADFDFAEADVGGEGLDGVALLVLQFAHEGVTVGSFSTPGFHLAAGGQHDVGLHLTALADFTDGCHGGYAGHEGVFVGIELVFIE